MNVSLTLILLNNSPGLILEKMMLLLNFIQVDWRRKFYHLRPISQIVKSYIKDTNDFLCKLTSLPPLPDDVKLCAIDVVRLYPNIPDGKGLIAIRKGLDLRKDKRIAAESLIELAECVLRNNILNTIFYFINN